MIIKNISPYPKTFKGLGNRQLLPGEECDLSSYSQKDRDNCGELQEGFRKGELICIGMGRQETKDLDTKTRMTRAQVVKDGTPQSFIEVQRGQRISPDRVSKLSEVRNPTSRDENPQEFLGELPVSRPFQDVKPPSRRPTPRIFDKPTGVIERDPSGAIISRPLHAPPIVVPPSLRKEPTPKEPPPTITPERIKEIWAQKCISFRTNGQKCRRWAVHNYEYCTAHMPKELMEKHKKEKKEQFFRE